MSSFTEELFSLKSLDFIIQEVSAVRMQQISILDLVEEAKALRLQNVEKDKHITSLENRVEDLEQYTRVNDVIITGLKIKPRSCARPWEGSPVSWMLTLRSIRWLISHSPMGSSWTVLTSRHPTHCPGETPVKIALLEEGRKLKGTDVSMNEHQANHNADTARRARQLEKQRKIQNT